MPNPPSWPKLRAGLIAAAVLTLAAIATLMYGRVGELHGAQVRLYVAMDGALGLIRGSDVWLDGQKVGTVNRIGLKAPGSGPPRTIVSVSLLKSELGHFRADSRVSIKNGGSVLGTPVLFVISGTNRGRGLQPEDTLIVEPTTTFTAQIDSTIKKVPAVLAGFHGVASDMSLIFRDVGTYTRNPSVTTELQHLQSHGARLTAKLSRAPLMDTTLNSRVARALADADSLHLSMQSSAMAMQKVRNDTGLVKAISTTRDELARLHKIVTSGDGTLARLQQDRSVDQQIQHAMQQMNELLADVHKHPFRYIAF